MKNKKMLIYTLVGATVLISSIIVFYKISTQEDKMQNSKMNALIARLANVYRSPITIGGEAVIYQPAIDKTVQNEIIAEGFNAVPYLIQALGGTNKNIAECCPYLLQSLPRKEGIEALINALNKTKAEGLFSSSIHSALHNMTGYSTAAPPGFFSQPDVQRLRQLWGDWWKQYKNCIVNTESGIGIQFESESIKPLPLKDWSIINVIPNQ